MALSTIPTTAHPDIATIIAWAASFTRYPLVAYDEKREAALIRRVHQHPGYVSETFEFVMRQMTADGSRQVSRHPVNHRAAEKIAKTKGDGAAAISAVLAELWKADPVAIGLGRIFGDLLFVPIIKQDPMKAPYEPFGGAYRPTSMRLGGTWEQAVYNRPRRLVDYAHHIEGDFFSLARNGAVAVRHPVLVQGKTSHIIGEGWWLALEPKGAFGSDFGPFDYRERDY